MWYGRLFGGEGNESCNACHVRSSTQRPAGERVAIDLAELLRRTYISIMTSPGTFSPETASRGTKKSWASLKIERKKCAMAQNTSKVWLITGSSRGLGRAIAQAALDAGHRVVATARKPEQLKDLIGRYGKNVLALELDVTNPEAASLSIRKAVDTFGRLDVLVNNAGHGDTAAVEDVTLEAFKAQIDTNFYSVVYMSKAALPVMRRQGSGHIFQISSIGGRLASPGLTAYQSAKWAVGGFSLGLAQEVAPLGIKVTIIEPGGMRTDWAGSSMTVPPISNPYQPTVGAFAKMLRELTGNEPTDPSKVAKAMLEVAEMAEPPLRLLMGTDAVMYVGNAAKELAASDAKWRALSESVGFDDAKQGGSNH